MCSEFALLTVCITSHIWQERLQVLNALNNGQHSRGVIGMQPTLEKPEDWMV